MTHIVPCARCPLSAGCDQRNEFRQKVRGLGLVSARFRCSKLRAEMRPGRRIVIRAPHLVDIASEHCDDWAQVHWKEVPATITYSDADYAFGCIVDRGAIPPDDCSDEAPEDADRKRRRRKQRHIRILRFLDEPDRIVCSRKGVVVGGECDSPGGCECHASEVATDG